MITEHRTTLCGPGTHGRGGRQLCPNYAPRGQRGLHDDELLLNRNKSIPSPQFNLPLEITPPPSSARVIDNPE